MVFKTRIASMPQKYTRPYCLKNMRTESDRKASKRGRVLMVRN